MSIAFGEPSSVAAVHTVLSDLQRRATMEFFSDVEVHLTSDLFLTVVLKSMSSGLSLGGSVCFT